MSRLFLSVASLLLLSLQMNTSSASEIEKWLLMPGEVFSDHAKIEAECDLCHSPLSDQPQGELCVDCHTDIAEDLEGSRGYHGRLPETQKLECVACHGDHEGREFDAVQLDEATFDHALTDFALRGAHSEVSCEGCHLPKTEFREAPSACVSCHLGDDVHNGSLGNECASCHTSNEWSEAEFDHSTTSFPLTGGHSEVLCDTCHLSEDFSDVGNTCIDCHRSDDVHKGQNGAECDSCHLTTDWTMVTFNHHTVSGFALIGGHENLTCNACHRSKDYLDLDGSTCQSCHNRQDVHNGRFGTDCGSCHNIFNWKSMRFDHAAETGFALPDGHGQLACSSCHTGNLKDTLSQDCGTCHKDDDVHNGQLGSECESCHVPDNWTGELWFDHDLTSFPLIGAHADVECSLCHATAAFHDADGNCNSCHFKDDPHNGSLGAQCQGCHNPASWEAWLFDHDKSTGFALTGAHADIRCSACHTESGVDSAALPQGCDSCHRRDDPHRGRFGNNCASCHSTESFSQIGNR